MYKKIILPREHTLSFKEELKIPQSIINKTIPELKNMVFDIFINFYNHGMLSKKELKELTEAYKKAKKAHNKTGKVRKGSKQPYIHHPLAVTIYAMHLAKLVGFKNINIKYLLLGAIYHDTVEDTKIFGTKDTGKQLSKFAKKYGDRFGIILYYVTKIPLNIDPVLEKLENHIKRIHLSIFNFKYVPMESRIIKIADRTMNLADLIYTPEEKRIATVYFTEKHFPPVLKFIHHKIEHLFREYLKQIRKAYSISDSDLANYHHKLKEKELN